MKGEDLSFLLTEDPAERLERSIEEYGELLRAAGELPAPVLDVVDRALRSRVLRLLAGPAEKAELQAAAAALRRLVPAARESELAVPLHRWRAFADLVEARLAEDSAPARDRRPGSDLDPLFGPRRGLAFEERVKRLLELHGYTVEPKQLLGGNEVDLVARKTGGLDEECWWVECKDHKQPVRKVVLETLFGWIDGREGRSQGARGMVVAREFGSAAVSYARDRPERLKVWTVEELERRLFDPGPYLRTLVTGFEQSPLARTYVAQQALLERKPEEEATVDLLDHAVAWANGDGSRLWLLLGDYGTGKSAFFQRLSAELARRALADPEAPFPLAIDLKAVPNATSAETLLFEHLRQRAPSFRGDPAALLHLLAAGRCVLLLDAFDEMGVAAAGRSVEEQFRELARLASEEPLDSRRGSRVLVTCRTHFFRDQQQVKDTATGRLVDVVAVEDSALGQLARRFNSEIDELLLFSEKQIAEFLQKHLGPIDAEKAARFIAATYDLPALAPRPVLLEMIVKSLPRLWQEETTQISPAGLYEVYTRQWLEDKSGRHLQTPPPLRHKLLGLLASALWRRADSQIHHRELLEEVKQLSEHFPGLDFDRVDVELRTAAFLVRSADGHYRFSHKSFLEYFLARGLWERLGGGVAEAAEALDLPLLSPEVGEFFWQLPGSGAEERLTILRDVLNAPYHARASENALRLSEWSGRVMGNPLDIDEAQLAIERTLDKPLGVGDAGLVGPRVTVNPIEIGRARPRLYYASGVDAETGEYLEPPRTASELAARAREYQSDREVQAALEKRLQADEEVAEGLRQRFDVRDLAQAGWGVIFLDGDERAASIHQALEPLRQLRRSQAGREREHYYQEYFGEKALQVASSRREFLTRNGAGEGPASPDNVPYYLLLVGDPELMSFRFQYELGIDYAVGRLHFDTLEEYSRYASSVVAAETQPPARLRRATFFGVENPNDPLTSESAHRLTWPLSQAVEGKAGWVVERVIGTDANKQRLTRLLGGDETPALLFTAGHGIGRQLGHPEQALRQGALVCSDWLGPRSPASRDMYFAAADVTDEAQLAGLISFHFADYSAGTPELDDYSYPRSGRREPIAPKPFVAHLPQRLLAHPNGGALAVIGHVGRSFVAAPRVAVLAEVFKRLMNGYPVGTALEPFNRLHASLAAQLVPWLEEEFRSEDRELVELWTNLQDARSYAILGDPAVRVPGIWKGAL